MSSKITQLDPANDVALAFDAPAQPTPPARWKHGRETNKIVRYTVELATPPESRLAILAQCRNRICAMEFVANGICVQCGTAMNFRMHQKGNEVVLAASVEVDQPVWESLWEEIQEGATFYVDQLFVVGPLP